MDSETSAVEEIRQQIIEMSDEGDHPWAPSTCECCGAEVESRHGVDHYYTCIDCSRAGCWPGDEAHPDRGGSDAELRHVNKAKVAMLDR